MISAYLFETFQKAWGVDDHPGRPLNEWFHHQSRDFLSLLFRDFSEVIQRSLTTQIGTQVGLPIGKRGWDRQGLKEQWMEDLVEDIDSAQADRSDGVSVITF